MTPTQKKLALANAYAQFAAELAGKASRVSAGSKAASQAYLKQAKQESLRARSYRDQAAAAAEHALYVRPVC